MPTSYTGPTKIARIAAYGAAAAIILGSGIAFTIRNSSNQQVFRCDENGNCAASGVLASNVTRNCDSVDTTSTGMLICGADATGGTGGGGASFNSGQVITTGDRRYVKKQGDTMTGALTINVTNGNYSTIGLKLINSASGSQFLAQKTLATSGSLVFEGPASGSTLYIATSLQGAGLTDCDLESQTLNWDSTTGRFTCLTDGGGSTYTAGVGLNLSSTAFQLNTTLTGSAIKFATVSGSFVTGNTVTSSGGLVWEGAASGSSLYVGTSIKGAGLSTDCDTPGTSKLLWDITTGRFSCGTDTDTNTTYSAGQNLTLGGTSFQLNTTITGSVIKGFTTISGSLITGNTLASSGALVFEGAASGSSLYLGTGLNGAGLSTCTGGNKLLWSGGRFSCTADLDTNTTYTAGQGLTLTSTAFKINSTITGSLINFLTVSGSTIYAHNTLTSSGSLKVLGNMSGSSLSVSRNASISGALTVLGSIRSHATLSGSTVHADVQLQSSGSLIIKGLSGCTNVQTSATGLFSCNSSTYQTTALAEDSVWVGNGTAQAALLPSCSGANNALLYNNGTNAFSCGTPAGTTYSAGQGLTLNSTSFKANATLSGTLVRFLTESGETLFAHTTLASSGSLKVLGRMSGATLTINGVASFSGSIISKGTIATHGAISGALIYAATTLSSSGSLNFEGAATGSSLFLGTSLKGAGLADCTGNNALRWANATGRFSCAADQTVGSAGQGLTNTNNSFKVNSTLTGTLVSFQTVSGSSISARLRLTSSGALKVLGNISGSSLNINTTGSFSGAILAETGAYFDTNTLVILASPNRVGIGTVSPRTTFDVVGSMSGSSLVVDNLITAGAIIYSSATGLAKTSAGSSGQLLISQGTNAPLFKKERSCERLALAGPQVQVAVGSGGVFPTMFSGALVDANLQASGVGSGVSVQVVINSNKVFSTVLSTDNKESNSDTAATPVVLTAANTRFNRHIPMRIDITSVGTLASTGVYLNLCYDITQF